MDSDEAASEYGTPPVDGILDVAENDSLQDNEEADEVLKDAAQAAECKLKGNKLYVEGKYSEAKAAYASAIALCPEEDAATCAVFNNNHAACSFMMKEYEDTVHYTSQAIDQDATYIKAYVRRAKAYEALEKLYEAQKDWKSILEQYPADPMALKNSARLEPLVKEQQEKQKAEMLGKLKDLGNGLLGKFGMSLDNFKLQQDPKTGGYNVSYQ